MEKDGIDEMKTRLVQMINVLFDNLMYIRRDAALRGLCTPAVSTNETRIVSTRFVTYGRKTESIDLIAVYP